MDVMKHWKFHSTWEQREAYRERYKEPFDQKTAEEACKVANHLWRGTGTQFKVIPIKGGFGLSQDVIPGWEFVTQR